MAKKKEGAALDTPRRRSKRLMKLKADNSSPRELHQQTDDHSSSTVALLSSETTIGNIDATATHSKDDTLEDLAADVFKNMKRMLVNTQESACEPLPSVVEHQPEVLMLDSVKAPCRKLQMSGNLVYIFDLKSIESEHHHSDLEIPSDFHHLTTKLQSNMKETPYFSFRPADIVASHLKKTSNINGDDDSEILSKSVITKDFETQSKAPPIRITKIQKRKLRKMQSDRSAGKEWFDLPATTITPELKNDLRILKMRGALDPSRHYKKNDTKELPKYFQVGTVIEGPGEFYSARIPKKSRQSTIVDELLADDKFRRYQKKKYEQLQHKFQGHKNIRFKRRFKKKTFLRF